MCDLGLSRKTRCDRRAIESKKSIETEERNRPKGGASGTGATVEKETQCCGETALSSETSHNSQDL